MTEATVLKKPLKSSRFVLCISSDDEEEEYDDAGTSFEEHCIDVSGSSSASTPIPEEVMANLKAIASRSRAIHSSDDPWGSPMASSKAPEMIDIILRCDGYRDQSYHMKMTDTFANVASTYKNRNDIRAPIKILSDGATIDITSAEHTPDFFGLDTGDVIDVQIETPVDISSDGDEILQLQDIGAGLQDEQTYTVIVRRGKEEWKFKIATEDKMEKLYKAFSVKSGLAMGKFDLVQDGETIPPSFTAEDAEIDDDGYVIDVSER